MEMTLSTEDRRMSDTKPTTRVPALPRARKQYELALSDTSANLAWAALHCGRLMHLSGDLEGARQAFRAAMIADDPEYTAVAAYHLGMLCEDLGDADAAVAAYREAAASGHPQHASAAAYKLGGMLRARGDVDGARAAFERAADAPNAWYGVLSRDALHALD
jgi:tetratricopeptide (TPR) repeat protein